MNNIWNESDLQDQLKAGCKAAFTRLYEMHSQSLYISLLKILKSEEAAEEVLQDTFVLLWEKRETITIHHNLQGYLFRIAVNKVHDFFRKLKRDKKLYDHIIETASSDCDNIIENSLPEDDTAFLLKALEVLPPQRRKVFYMCKMEGRSYKEVSQILGISTSTINDHIVKATSTVRELVLSHSKIKAMSFLLFVFLF